jgi:uncharacterized protein Smg (DUF494 family)
MIIQMYERIVEIIVYVISEIKYSDKVISDINYNELERLGYSRSEISAALSWIIDSQDFSKKFTLEDAPTSDGISFRILHGSERDIFSLEAWGEINLMMTLGLINSEQIEFIIERASLSGLKLIDKEMLRNIFSSILFNQLIFQNPTNKSYLNGSECIN